MVNKLLEMHSEISQQTLILVIFNLWHFTMCRFWMVSLTTEDVMSIALAFACGKFIAVICRIHI